MRKPKGRRHDTNQQMLFTEEEMSGKSTATSTSISTSASTSTFSSASTSSAASAMPSAAPQPAPQAPQAGSSITAMLLSSLQLLDQYNPQEVQLIAMQAAALIQGGIDRHATYTLPSMPGVALQGSMLTALAYTSIARSFPSMIERLGLHWSSEYSEAQKIYSKS